MRDTPRVDDHHIIRLAELVEQQTGKRLSMEDARAIGEDLMKFVLLLDSGDRQQRLEAAADVEGEASVTSTHRVEVSTRS